MLQDNYIKDYFFSYIKQDLDLFNQIVVLNKKHFFVFDFFSQDFLWISEYLCKKLGFKDKENDLHFWKKHILFNITQITNQKTDIEFVNDQGVSVTSPVLIHELFDEKRNIKFLVGIVESSLRFKDFNKKVSRIKRFQNTLIENQDRFNFISENISDGIYIIENEQLVFTSGAYLKMMGMSEQQKQSNHKVDMFGMVHPDDLEPVKKIIYGAAAQLLPSVKYVFRCRRGDGEYIWREDIMNIQYNEKNEPVKVVTIARDITQEKLEKLESEKKQKNTERQNNLLINIYSSVSTKSLQDKIKEVTVLATKGLTIDRASFWEISEDELVCNDLYDKNQNKHLKDHFFKIREIPKYIAAVNNQVALVADDVYDNEATSELIDNYLKPLGITDMLDIPIRANGKFYGVLCCEHRDDPRVWSENDISFARALADYLSLAIEEDKRIIAETQLNENQEQLKFISENTSDGILVIENNKISYVSPVFAKLSGYTETYIKKLTLGEVFDFIHPEDAVKITEVIYKNLSVQNGKFSYEYRFKGASGEYQWREDSANVIYNPDGTYSKYILVSRDISERKQTETKLIESEQQLRLITENTSDGVAVIESGKLSYVSPSYMRLLNYSKEEYLNFTPDDIYDKFHPEDLVKVKPYIKECLSKQMREFKYEMRFRDVYGNYHWREDSANVIYDENGRYSKYIVVTRDISARKESDKEKNRLYEITEKQNQKLINFTHIVSHDIRSHTSNLAMILDLFEQTNDLDEQKEYFTMLKQSTNKLSDTIFFLNETVAIQSGGKNDFVTLNLKKEIEHTILGINAIIKSNKAIININVSEDIEVKVTQSYLESIIFNLLTNAIKYKSKDKSPIINITASLQNEEVVLKISDNGLGIDLEKNREKVFGMYKTFHGNSDAVGLGLFMVKNHIESMGGRVEIESEVGKGTTFTLYFV
ncbi:PAS domain-containing protein [Flavobacterium terrae]|uniref:histidine kinase n=1 Tax=Flavobacterium terrae TaxID=415425 RepID=A0A1M6CIS4_9FLAO|nr:PAS domain-containing protein [Flavobacterium terrae]SHI60932.1 PAS domain S-box-containing protein [Flavobacterium terrae]